MKTLSKARDFLRRHSQGETVLGLFLALAAVGLSVFYHFPYFYSLLVIGVFLFFDGLYHVFLPGTTLDISLMEPRFLVIMMVFVLLTDLVAGQMIFRAWTYPSYWNILNWVLLYVIIYPVGGLSVIAMYRVVKLFLDRILPFNSSEVVRCPRWLVKLLWSGFGVLVVMTLFTLIVFLNGWFNLIVDSRPLYDFLVTGLLLSWMTVFEVGTVLLGGVPVFADVVAGRSGVGLAIVVTGLLGALSHEFINTFSYEWIYDPGRMPFTQGHFLNVPVFVFFAWIPMVFVCVSLYRMSHYFRLKVQK